MLYSLSVSRGLWGSCCERHLHFDNLAVEVLAVARSIRSTDTAASKAVIEACAPPTRTIHPKSTFLMTHERTSVPPSSKKTDVSAPKRRLPGPICQATCRYA